MRIILHFDMDYFFAQIEERENPHFKGKPIIVGADPKRGKGRGVVATCNYEARKYGIKSGMPISQAYSLCPQALFLPVNFELYEKVSNQIMEIAKKYSPLWEIVSLDEAYLDLTSIAKNFTEAQEIGKRLKNEIFEKEKLTCSVGIGPNKLIAKIATEKAKPNGLLVVQEKEINDFLDPLDVEILPGIGPKTAQKLREIGINKIFQLRKLRKSKLKEMFGKVGERIFEISRGIDREPVRSRRIIKSIGKQITLEKDTKNPEIIFQNFEEILEKVYSQLIEKDLYFKTIRVIFRDKNFKTISKSRALNKRTQDFRVLEREAKKLLLKILLKEKNPVRLLGVRLEVS